MQYANYQEQNNTMTMPTFAILPFDHPVVALAPLLRASQNPPKAIEIFGMAHFAPVECLNAFIIMLCTGEWGSFWENYFGRLTPNAAADTSNKPRCELFGEHLRNHVDKMCQTTTHDQLIAQALEILLPLEREINEMASFFTVLPTSPNVVIPQALGRREPILKPDPLNHMSPLVLVGERRHPLVTDPVVQKKPLECPTVVCQIQRGYEPMTLANIARALRGVRLSQEHMRNIRSSTNMAINAETGTALTLAEVLRDLSTLMKHKNLQNEDQLVGRLCKALFDHEHYIMTDLPTPQPLELANMIWSLVVHCGYNLTNRPTARSETATGVQVRANIFARLVLGLYKGKTPNALLNSLRGEISIAGQTPSKPWTELGYFPELFSLLD